MKKINTCCTFGLLKDTMKYEERKHVGEINCTFGRGEGLLKLKIEEGVIDKKGGKYRGCYVQAWKYWGGGKTKCKITKRMFKSQHW